VERWKKEKFMAAFNPMGTNRSTTTVPANSVSSLGVINRQIPGASAPVGVAPKFAPTLTEEEAVVQARLLKALADPTRLRILSLLSRYEGEVCVFEIVESFTLEQPTISHHLRILRDAGLVDCRKKGLWAYYYVRREALNRAQEIIGGLA
jgi:ArsR family transcriptional regulator, arsenate/arsenite/antimonite-responsive transcriptional repressor